MGNEGEYYIRNKDGTESKVTSVTPNIYNKRTVIENARVEILENTWTDDISFGWFPPDPDDFEQTFDIFSDKMFKALELPYSEEETIKYHLETIKKSLARKYFKPHETDI